MTTPDNPFAAPEPGAAPQAQPPTPPPVYGQPPYASPPGYGYAPHPGAPPPYGQPFPPYGYGQPPYGFGMPVSNRTNGMAIASLVLGILWVYWIGSILALVFGYIARSQIKQHGEGGGGMATAGIVLGWIGIGVLVLIAVLGASGAFDTGTQYEY